MGFHVSLGECMHHEPQRKEALRPAHSDLLLNLTAATVRTVQTLFYIPDAEAIA